MLKPFLKSIAVSVVVLGLGVLFAYHSPVWVLDCRRTSATSVNASLQQHMLGLIPIGKEELPNLLSATAETTSQTITKKGGGTRTTTGEIIKLTYSGGESFMGNFVGAWGVETSAERINAFLADKNVREWREWQVDIPFFVGGWVATLLGLLVIWSAFVGFIKSSRLRAARSHSKP